MLLLYLSTILSMINTLNIGENFKFHIQDREVQDREIYHNDFSLKVLIAFDTSMLKDLTIESEAPKSTSLCF